jgi:adenine-specific DNA-methyltransferase
MIAIEIPPLAADMPLPRAGAHREALRVNGQFWTPEWVANAMVAYTLQAGASTLFDPGIGAGIFFHVGRKQGGADLLLRGCEIDPAAIQAARMSGLSAKDLSGVELRDFALRPPVEHFPAIVANPPYVRHHRITKTAKLTLHAFARGLIGRPLDGRAGLHVFFLLRCLEQLEPGGRLAFIVSADICEGAYADALWSWFSKRYCLDAVVTFAPDASPFPGVDTNVLLLLVRREPPAAEFSWAQVLTPGGDALTNWIKEGRSNIPASPEMKVIRRTLTEGIATGLSRAPDASAATRYRLCDFARVMRGIATGENDFFFMTARRAAELGLPRKLFIPAIGRMRDVSDKIFSAADLARLDAAGRPTQLLSLGAEPRERLPAAVQRYLATGEASGLPASALIATRKPWYRMERRAPPPFLFAYLGRQAVRFIRNTTDAVPLTCLLCVYPHNTEAGHIQRLWRVLSDPRTVANLRLVGKSYGDGALKVEPRALQQLPLPDVVLAENGLLNYPERSQGEFILAEDKPVRSHHVRAKGKPRKTLARKKISL